ncbi:Hypothetical_protein [Hexamita inflata]|uniref:Hypothetical_protein n=1 Tax=Hexamita inflata TaxID=28002 RepID=A0AA86U6R2_9EUKA|nr:Hypothetical protein HINF_LOCUS29086 [Hexamita inflata]
MKVMKMNHIMNLSELHSSGTYDIYTNINFLVLITYMFLKLMRHLRRTQINTWSKKTQPMTQKKLYPSYYCPKDAWVVRLFASFLTRKDAKTHLRCNQEVKKQSVHIFVSGLNGYEVKLINELYTLWVWINTMTNKITIISKLTQLTLTCRELIIIFCILQWIDTKHMI